MRRMYSEQELTNVIKVVFEQELADGALDESIADAVDAYLVEHPVDITALEGQTINPARIDVANINGEANPSVKPIYFHPIEMHNYSGVNGYDLYLSMMVLNNSPTAFTKSTLKTFLKSIDEAKWLLTGALCKSADGKYLSPAYAYNYSGTLYIYGVENTGAIWESSNHPVTLEEVLDSANTQFSDGVNKIN